MGLTHFDIGGYTTVVRHGTTENVVVQMNMVRTEELFMRGAEMAMFTPVMRTHEGKWIHWTRGLPSKKNVRIRTTFDVTSKERSHRLPHPMGRLYGWHL